jgi:membrane protein DedA with SNARE-associated domain
MSLLEIAEGIRIFLSGHELWAVFLISFVSEDLACIGAGALVKSGVLLFWQAAAVSGFGIFAGDVVLWFLGRALATWFSSSIWSAKLKEHARYKILESRFKENLMPAIIGSRFVPGLRLPTYLLAGYLRSDVRKTFLLFAVASFVWAPMLVGVSAGLLSPLQIGFSFLRVPPVFAVALAVVTLFLAVRVFMRTVQKFESFEFWPAWLVYFPLVFYIVYLIFRNRSLMAPASSNPFLPFSGMVGESKSDILRALPADCTLSHCMIPTGSLETRLRLFKEQSAICGISFPMVLKPNAGQRGAGVRLVSTPLELEEYIRANEHDVIAQTLHEGPFEAGIFYYRYPNETKGQILSITDKVWPWIVGDGARTVCQLVCQNERFKKQKVVFEKRHQAIWHNV